MSDAGTPENWARTQLAEVAFINPRSLDQTPADNELVSFVPMAAVQEESGNLDASTLKPWKDVSKGYTRFQENDVLFAKITPCMENGKYALAKGLHGGRAAGSTEFHVFRPSEALSPKFLLLFLFRSELRRAARLSMRGAAGQLRVPPEFFSELEINLPPRTEQDRIVAEIEKQFTRLDDAVAALKRVQANLKRYRASMLKAACEGRLVPTEAELARKEGRSYEPASELLKRILAERRAKWEADQLQRMIAVGKPPKNEDWKKKYKEPVAPTLSDLPHLPEGWTWTTFDQLITFGPQNGIYKPSTAYGSGTKIVRIDDYQDDSFKAPEELRQLNLDETESCLYALESGDMLINRVNSPSHLGKCCVITSDIAGSVFESNMMRLRLASDVQKGFFLAYLRSLDGKRRLTSNAKWAVNQASINQQDVANTPVPLPPLEEQSRISAELDRRITNIDNIKSYLTSRLMSASQLRSAVLKTAFFGKLVPQDPNDEPASVLLERIRAERAALATNNGNQKATPKAGTANGQRRRRVKKLAQGVSPGKG